MMTSCLSSLEHTRKTFQPALKSFFLCRFWRQSTRGSFLNLALQHKILSPPKKESEPLTIPDTLPTCTTSNITVPGCLDTVSLQQGGNTTPSRANFERWQYQLLVATRKMAETVDCTQIGGFWYKLLASFNAGATSCDKVQHFSRSPHDDSILLADSSPDTINPNSTDCEPSSWSPSEDC